MYWRKFTKKNLDIYREATKLTSKLFRFGHPLAYVKPSMKHVERSYEYVAAVTDLKKMTREGEFVNSIVDYKKSKGNFLVDVDGNVMLDLVAHGGLLPLGYNADALINARDSKLFDRYLNQSPNLAEYPPSEFPDFVREAILPIAPEGLSEVYFTEGIGSQANETALKIALLKFKESRGSGLAEVDWDNFAENDWSNSSDLLQNNVSVLGFENSLHGVTLGGASASGTAMVRGSLPTYDWPTAPMPKVKYPHAFNVSHNKKEEKRCLKVVEKIIAKKEKSGSPVGAMIIEPITFLKNTVATPNFYRSLRKIAKERGIPFIVDETRTGIGKTGKMWAYEHWYLEDQPDIVTFGGSAHASGVFTSADFRPLEPHKLTNISNGSMDKLLALGVIGKYIQKKNLLNKVDD